MTFINGKRYRAQSISKHSKEFKDVQMVMDKKTKSGYSNTKLLELWSIRWVNKPFKWSYSKEFKPNRRFFWHGTSKKNIQKILNNGFMVGGSNVNASNGSMLGKGVYVAYHTNKVCQYATDGFILSVMVYTPKRLIIQKGQLLTKQQHANGAKKYHAIEVLSGANVFNKKGGTAMLNHEICVFNPLRVVPRYICKIK